MHCCTQILAFLSFIHLHVVCPYCRIQYFIQQYATTYALSPFLHPCFALAIVAACSCSSSLDFISDSSTSVNDDGFSSSS